MSEIHGAVGSYVINALDADELDEFEAHLAVCPTCSNEVVEFCETAAQLALLAAPTAPPPALRSSILSAISDVRPLPPEAPAPLIEELPRRGVVETTSEPAPTDELALRRQHRRSRLLTLAVAAVTVIALSLGGAVFSLSQNQQNQVVATSLETQLLNAPDLQVLTSPTENGGKASFLVSKSLNKAMLATRDLPALKADQTYQTWTLRGKAASPDTLVADGGTNAWMTGPIDDSTALAVTIEPGQGSATPTFPIQASVEL